MKKTSEGKILSWAVRHKGRKREEENSGSTTAKGYR